MLFGGETQVQKRKMHTANGSNFNKNEHEQPKHNTNISLDQKKKHWQEKTHRTVDAFFRGFR